MIGHTDLSLVKSSLDEGIGGLEGLDFLSLVPQFVFEHTARVERLLPFFLALDFAFDSTCELGAVGLRCPLPNDGIFKPGQG